MTPSITTPSMVPVEQVDVVLLDLDGVVYVGDRAVPHAVPSIESARSRGMRPAYVTNNASRTPEEVAAHLVELGLTASASDVVTSAQAGAHALQRILVDRGLDGPVLAIGGPGVGQALRERGLETTGSADDRPVAVLQGFGRELSWGDLAEASIAVGRGAIWVATNPDTSIPIPRGRAPGNGAFVRAVELATGRQPDTIAGKPHRPLIDECIERTGARRALMVGDRLDTDIEAGAVAGIPTLLVMTGVTDVVDVLLAPPTQRPDMISLDLRGLHQHFPAVEGGGSWWRCGRVDIRWSQDPDDLQVALEGDRDLDGSRGFADPADWVAVMRCLTTAVWERPPRPVPHGQAVDLNDTRQSLLRIHAVRALQASVDRLRLPLGE